MGISKKDLEFFAELFGKHYATKQLVEEAVTYFASNNKLFDDSRFFEAIEHARRKVEAEDNEILAKWNRGW